MANQKTRRGSPAVNAGSMADIAFLLLIFFLVTTTIQEDKGVLVRLPQWVDDPIVQDFDQRNVLTVLINSGDELMVENRAARVADLPDLLHDHVISPLRKPANAVVSLTHDRGTSYERYLQVYDALKAGYRRMWDERARRDYGTTYDELDISRQRTIRDALPMIISEAEPSTLGEEA